MPNPELWDLFNSNRQPLNKLHTRGEKMPLGEYHIVVEIWTINSNKEILLTLRDPKKECYPNTWENTAGSILTGETSKQGAVRELFEETGIKITEEELIFIGTNKENTAFVDMYVVKKDITIEELTMQEGETVLAQWVTLEKLDEMMNSGVISDPIVNRLKPFRREFEKFLS